jgi:hypothetical protein
MISAKYSSGFLSLNGHLILQPRNPSSFSQRTPNGSEYDLNIPKLPVLKISKHTLLELPNLAASSRMLISLYEMLCARARPASDGEDDESVVPPQPIEISGPTNFRHGVSVKIDRTGNFNATRGNAGCGRV